MNNRHLKGQGEVDYDYFNDIFFFKMKNREYKESIELDNILVDFDKEDFITGAQIFGASKYFQVSKEALRSVKKCEFNASIHDNRLEIRLTFQAIVRNKPVEIKPIIRESIKKKIPNSEIVCACA